MSFFFLSRKKVASVALNLRLITGPYGGGNQWVSQISPYLTRCGYDVRFDLRRQSDCLLLTHAGMSGRLQFNVDEIRQFKDRHPRVRVIQRINDNDKRKGTSAMNAILAETNKVADHTVFVSEWLRDHHTALWFDAGRPHSVIRNGADPAAFHPIDSRVFSKDESLRLVTHHWSDNWIKGFAIYREIDFLIASGDLANTELWVIGRWPREIEWKSARTFPPASGNSLADLLRQCHVCVTASLWEPGAMHPVEALQCGLPLLYHEDSGGTVEFGKRFGVPFRENIVNAIFEMRDRYGELRQRVLREAPSGDLMCVEYQRLVQQLIAEERAE